MRRSELLLSRKCLIGILVWIAIIIPSESLRGSAVVLQAKTKLAETKLETEDETNKFLTNSSSSLTKPHLTGIPQIDYVLDPNLPRELNGHNLTDYPFYNAVPEEIDFKCDGLHDGFYASVPHKCQVYHHCLFGTRYDFLCANYTAFDQKTFICHFVSEVDCANSPKYYKRNEALYKEATTASTTTTTSTTPSTTTANVQPNGNGGGMKHMNAGRRRRPFRRRRPMYEYYYDDEEYADSDYYEEEVASLNHRRNPNRKQNKDTYDENHESESDYDSHNEPSKSLVRPTNSGGSVYERPRVPPKIRRPVPKNERDKYEYIPKASTLTPTSTQKSLQSTQSPKMKTSSTLAPSEDDYYEEDDEYEYDEPKNVKAKPQVDYDFPTGFEETRRYVSRHRARVPVRKRTDMYDDYDIKTRPRMNRRKEYTRYESEHPRNGRPGMYRNNKNRQEEPIQGYKKRVMGDSEYRRRPEMKRPSAEYDYYYDDEEEEPLPKRNRRPLKVEKPKLNKPTTNKNERIVPKVPETTTTYQKIKNNQRTAKANNLENETPKENEIPTTENVSVRTTPKYKTVKIVNNSLKDDLDEGVDYVSTEETKTYLTQTRPFFMVTKAIPKTEPKKPLDEIQNKTITQIRHFVITTPIRKPSHLGIFNPAANASYKEEVSKLPESKPQEYYMPAHYIKIPVTSPNQNLSTYQGLNFGKYFIPIEQSRKAKPVEEHLSENLNVISNGINFNNAFITEPKPFDTSKQQPYRQDQRPYLVGERLYTNSITFPHQPPSNYDITAPGPSAPADEPQTSEKKYTDLRGYTANVDYDVTYNDALQPSTLQPVRRFPSTSFYVQNPSRRLPLEYAFNESAFNTLNRSQNRYK